MNNVPSPTSFLSRKISLCPASIANFSSLFLLCFGYINSLIGGWTIDFELVISQYVLPDYYCCYWTFEFPKSPVQLFNVQNFRPFPSPFSFSPVSSIPLVFFASFFLSEGDSRPPSVLVFIGMLSRFTSVLSCFLSCHLDRGLYEGSNVQIY